MVEKEQSQTYMVDTEPLGPLGPQTELRPDRRLSFRNFAYFSYVRFEDTKHTIKLEEKSLLGGVDPFRAETTYFLLLHVDDEHPATDFADGTELDVLIPTDVLWCLRSVLCPR